MAARTTKPSGLPVDATGGPTIDPTANVIALVEANAKAAAALRDADVRFNNAQHEHLKEIGQLRANHAKETRTFDSERQSSIRDVDMANAEKTAAQILQAVNTNAAVAERTAKTLQDQVASTAAAQENRQASFAADMMKRLSAVELSMSKGEGKQAVADPASERLATSVEKLLMAQQLGTGKGEGIGLVGIVVMGAVALIGGLLGIAGILYGVLQRGPTP